MLLAAPQWTRLCRTGLLLGSLLLYCTGGKCESRPANHPGLGAEPFEVRPSEGPWQPNSVTEIVQSRDGYLWLGTYHGLVRFDGVSYTVFDSSNTPKLPNGRITSLYESPEHVLWIGHETGHVTRFENGRFESINPGTNWPGGVVEAISSDETNDIWLLNVGGFLFRLRDGKIVTTPGGASPVRRATLARAKGGRLWISSNGRVAMLDSGNIVPVSFREDQPNAFYERVFPAQDGGIWVLGNGRFREWRDGEWSTQVPFPSLPGAVNVMVETRFGILVGTMRDGLYLLRFGTDPLHFSRANGLSHDWIRSLFVDQEGNCWIGTGAGFDGLRPRKVRMVSPPDAWKGCAVRSFIVHSDDTAWIGTEGAGLYHYDGHRWKVFDEKAGLFGLFVWSVLETKEQELFAGTWGGGLFRRNSERFESVGDLSRITAPVTALYQGRGGEIWIGTQEGLHRYEAGHLVWFAGKDKLALPDVRTITESSDGTLWFGMYGGGLGALREGALKQFRHADGLSSDLLNCLYADTDDTLWIGTADNGLTRLQRGKFSTISSAQGLPSKVICHIVDDGVGHLWMGSQNGILRVSKAALHRSANGDAGIFPSLNYGRAEGLTAQTCSGGFQPGACKTEDGRLWFPTVKGLAVVDPANVTTNSIPPPVVIESLFVDGSTTNWIKGEELPTSTIVPTALNPESKSETKPLRITPGHQRFEFHYTGLSFAAPDKVRFRHTLLGLENDWVDAGTKRTAVYTFLPPGKYTFKAIACNNDDLWNMQGASVTFTVLPYFWQTFLFRAASTVAAVLALAGGIFWAARHRLRRKLAQLEHQRALERERTRIARDIHDDLGSSLTRITMLSQSVRGEVETQPQAAADIDQIYSTAREITRAMDEIVWAVNPRYDTLESLAAYLGRFAQQYLSAANIRCRLEMPVQFPSLALSAEVRHNVFLAFKETLNNIVKHAQATEVSISLQLRPTEFMLLVVDNGRGINWNGKSSESNQSHTNLRSASGHGLVNMQKRMEEIGGHCGWDSAPGEGTRTTFRVTIKP